VTSVKNTIKCFKRRQATQRGNRESESTVVVTNQDSVGSNHQIELVGSDVVKLLKPEISCTPKLKIHRIY
jgi:hypothetical protein